MTTYVGNQELAIRQNHDVQSVRDDISITVWIDGHGVGWSGPVLAPLDKCVVHSHSHYAMDRCKLGLPPCACPGSGTIVVSTPTYAEPLRMEQRRWQEGRWVVLDPWALPL